jgi:hypothetical protein
MTTNDYWLKLHRKLCDSFSVEELRTLCLYLEVDYGSLGGEERDGKARELIGYLKRRGRVNALIERCRVLRDQIPWEDPPANPVPSAKANYVPVVTSPRPSTPKKSPHKPKPPSPTSSPIYVERGADQWVWERLKQRQAVMLVEPRGHGKTSLIHHLSARCKGNWTLAYVDMIRLATSTEQESWYEALGEELLHQLLPVIAGNSTVAIRKPTSSNTWFYFLDDLVQLASDRGKVVIIALDEVGVIRAEWATDFFAAIRSAYAHRSGMPNFYNLTFIIAGVPNPRAMIRDPQIPAFNFERIPIADLNLNQVKSLLEPLCPESGINVVAERLYYWTDGQPYLCQKLCEYLANATGIPNADSVDAAVDALFLAGSSHIQGILDDLTNTPNLLDVLRKSLHKPSKFRPALIRDHFTLAHVIGILSPKTEFCRVRNRIYRYALIEKRLFKTLPEWQ